MRFEFYTTANRVTYKDYEQGIKSFQCNNDYHYRDLCEVLLSESQRDRLVGLCKDGIYNISKKRYLAGLVYMENNIWNKRK